MCGIVGYLGYRNAQDVIVSSLQKLEYRGYDSCGLAILNSENKIEYMKTAGKINDLKEMLIEYRIPGNFGIGHTRWATHGKP
ncbi:MAG: glutamine--fructose-6-phosphate aminotransferase, partial [SAR202 cluster bacterium]|nr:glutamine--fructose-6-phosphate aminotransferase [SAR202 cluster bacterium]